MPKDWTGDRAVTAVSPERLMFPKLGELYQWGEPKAYAVLRVVYGLVLLTHGLPKLLGYPHGDLKEPFAATVDMIGNMMHWPAPLFFAYLVTVVETVGVILIAAGFLTRAVAAMLLFEMVMICIAIYPTWVWTMHGMEYPLLLGLISLYMIFRGSGAYSLERLLGWAV